MRAYVTALAVALASAGCGWFGRAPDPRTGETPPGWVEPATPARMELRQNADHPPISLVQRQGDPYPALALAVAHDFGSEASVALGKLVEIRLRAAGFPSARSAPHGLGFQISTLVTSPEEADRFVNAAARALRTPFSSTEAFAAAIRESLGALEAHGFINPGDREVARCSGDLGLPQGASLVDPATPAGAAKIEKWRRSVFTTGAAAFAAIGSKPVLDAAAGALTTSQAWPRGPGPEDAWPKSDVVGAAPGKQKRRQLSVAFWVAESSAALEAVRSFGAARSDLAERLRIFDPSWSVRRATATTRPRGACMRVDLASASKAEPPPADIASAALAVTDEVERALGSAKQGDWALEDSVLRATDPRDAASTAAWHALSGKRAGGVSRRNVSYSSRIGEVPRQEDLALELARQAAPRSTIALEKSVETGQGELWMLLGSPCGTLSESTSNAGTLGLAVRAIAESATGYAGVELEPWITTDGVGVLAHAPRRDRTETPDAHAARIARALSRAFGRRLGTRVARARSLVLDELGPEPHPNWWLAVSALSPEHPSWLDPRGTWKSVNESASHDVDLSRQALVSGPLRLAMLANWDAAQWRTGAATVERWLGPRRRQTTACPTPPPQQPRAGKFTIETNPDGLRARAIVGVAIPASGSGSRAADLRWTTWLLNRRRGWLDRALREPGLATTAQATLLGGEHHAAILIELDSVDDQLDAAVSQVRALLERLARGAVNRRDLTRAQRHFDSMKSEMVLSPRHRVVQLWRAAPEAAPSLASLRGLHALFVPDRHVIVIAEVEQ